VDKEGFLIDREGNRMLNGDGDEVQWGEEDFERLREDMGGE
jgi:hypothetical protein